MCMRMYRSNDSKPVTQSMGPRLSITSGWHGCIWLKLQPGKSNVTYNTVLIHNLVTYSQTYK